MSAETIKAKIEESLVSLPAECQFRWSDTTLRKWILEISKYRTAKHQARESDNKTGSHLWELKLVNDGANRRCWWRNGVCPDREEGETCLVNTNIIHPLADTIEYADIDSILRID